MAKRASIICDKCGRDIVNPNTYYSPDYALHKFSAKMTLWGVGVERYQTGQRIDLCEECFEKFINFIEGENQCAEERG